MHYIENRRRSKVVLYDEVIQTAVFNGSDSVLFMNLIRLLYRAHGK